MAKKQKQTIPIAFGRALKEFRISKGMTQEGIALECNIDRSFISLLERGLKQPSITTIVGLASALEVNPSELVKKMENMLQK